MAILFAGNELDSFTFSGGGVGSVTTDSTYFNSNFCRCAIGINPATSIGYGTLTLPDAKSSIWFHTDVYLGANWTTNNNMIEIRSATYGAVARLRTSGTQSITAEVFDGASWVSFGTYNTFPYQVVVTLDIYLSLAPTGGQAAWYINSGLVGTYTGDTQGYASTTIIDNVRLWTQYNGNLWTYYSQLIVADEDTRGMKVATLFPNGAGALSDWTGTFADVDETAITDSDYISTNAASTGELFTMSDLSTTAQTGYDVKAVVQSGRASKGLTGPQNLQYYMYSNGTVNPSPNIAGLTNNFATLPQYIWATDPSTGSAWTVANVNNLQAGFKSIA